MEIPMTRLLAALRACSNSPLIRALRTLDAHFAPLRALQQRLEERPTLEIPEALHTPRRGPHGRW